MRAQRQSSPLLKWFLFGGAAVLILFGAFYLASVTYIAPKLVDTARRRTEDYLSKQFKSSVQIAAFHVRVFPTIRVDAKGIVLRHQGRTDVPPMIQIQSASFDANFEGLIGRKVDVNSIRLEGLTIDMPPRKSGDPPMFKGTDDDLAEKYPVVIHHIVADNVSLVMLRNPDELDKSPKVFEIHALRLQNSSFSHPASFQALLTNPKPHGLIHCQGEFGPWLADEPSQTPVSGVYTFQNADMSTLSLVQISCVPLTPTWTACADLTKRASAGNPPKRPLTGGFSCPSEVVATWATLPAQFGQHPNAMPTCPGLANDHPIKSMT